MIRRSLEDQPQNILEALFIQSPDSFCSFVSAFHFLRHEFFKILSVSVIEQTKLRLLIYDLIGPL